MPAEPTSVRRLDEKMHDWIEERERRLREVFGLASKTELISRDVVEAFEVTPPVAAHLARFNIEWHIVPAADAISVEDDAYRQRLYPMLMRTLKRQEYQKTSSYKAIISGHSRHQGRILGIETTLKPRYLPGNRQLYGTPYGFEAADPFAPYMGQAGMMSGTRYAHNYTSLRGFVNAVNADWQQRSLLPRGFRLTICPPMVFNLIGTI